MCQRYYAKSYNQANAPGTATVNGMLGISGNGSGYGEYMQLRFPINMRTSPTVVLYSNVTGASGNIRNINSSVDVATSAGAIGESGFCNPGVALSAATNYSFQYTASAEL